jgi:hypothetical protein
MRKSDSLRRRPPFREQLPRILIVCEGIVTEKRYFEYLGRAERISVQLMVQAGGTPKALVERAVELKKSAGAGGFDEVWCVFDIDEHPLVPDAKQQARDNGIQLAISNPCFELWALLHFQDQRAEIDRRQTQRLCRQHIAGYQKVVALRGTGAKASGGSGSRHEVGSMASGSR